MLVLPTKYNHNIMVEIYPYLLKGIALEHFIALPQTEINLSTKICPQHAVFHSFFLNDTKQDADTTTANSKSLIEL